MLLLLVQSMVGAVVSTTITVWLHVALLLQASLACQVRVASKVLPQWLAVFVTVLTIVMFALPQVSLACQARVASKVPSQCPAVLVSVLNITKG